MQAKLNRVLGLAFLTLGACAPPTDDSIELKQYPEPGIGLSETVTDHPLAVQLESMTVTDQSRWGRLIFDRTEIDEPAGSQGDIEELADLIESYHRHWLSRDDDELMRLFDQNVTRFRQGRVAYGAAEVRAGILQESRGERPEGHTTSMQLEIRNVRIRVRGDFASALYSVAIHGGARWEYTDLATIQQLFRKGDYQWRIIGHTESLRLDDHDVPAAAENVPIRRAPFRFDFVYPVQDLQRAINFYEPLLGPPAARSSTRASFRLADSYFELEAEPIDPRLTIEKGLANGYATVDVDSLADIARRLSETGDSHIELTSCGQDECMVTEDPSGNVIVWREVIVTESADTVRPTVSFASGARPDSLMGPQLFLTMATWMATDQERLTSRLTDDAIWVDDALSVATGSA